MTEAPSIKEAWQSVAKRYLDDITDDLPPEVKAPTHDELGDALLAALATFQPDGERREAIARLATRFWSIHPKEIQDMGLTREQFYVREMTNLLASGLVQNEAGIRADEREKLRNRLDSHLNDFLCGMKEGWDDSVSGFNDAWDVVRKVFDAAAIRSARDGGE